MTNLTPHEAQRILELTDAGMPLPPELHRRALEFCAEVNEAAERMAREAAVRELEAINEYLRVISMPWRRILYRWGWR